MLLHTLASCSSCTPKPQKIQLLVCTANVYGFQCPAAAELVKTLDALRQPDDDVVVFGFQETSASHQQQYFEKVLPQFRIFYDGSGCSNTLAIFTKKGLKMHNTVVKLPQLPTAMPGRYALLLELPSWDIKVATTHLAGGRHDDQHWMDFTDGREQQLATILRHQPTILMGDFNADSRLEQPLVQYWQTFLQKAPGKTLDDLIRYNTEIHKYLAEQGYTTAICRKELKQTTPFGTVVDWIYLSFQKHTYVIKAWGVVRGIAQDLSDHDFPWIRLEVTLQQ